MNRQQIRLVVIVVAIVLGTNGTILFITSLDNVEEKPDLAPTKIDNSNNNGTALDEFLTENEKRAIQDITKIEQQSIEEVQKNIEKVKEQMIQLETTTSRTIELLSNYLLKLNDRLADLEIPDDKEPDITTDAESIDEWFESLDMETRNKIIKENNVWNNLQAADESDYQFSPNSQAQSYWSAGSTTTADEAMLEDSSNIGLAVGGAQDINNFRENINNGYLPIPQDITYEGLFYDYYFDTNQNKICEELFCPSYTNKIIKDPFSDKDEYYMSVGLNSGIKESDFERNNLNLVIVLDVSGSMGAPFDLYYYDSLGNRIVKEDHLDEEEYSKAKITVAAESIVALIEHLTPEDRLGIVLFDGSSYVVRPLSNMVGLDRETLSDHILDLYEMGSTNMEAGIRSAEKMYSDIPSNDYIPKHVKNGKPYDNRIIFLTDAMPNQGSTSGKSFQNMFEDLADKTIYSSIIGIGVDFNSKLINDITKNIKGSNYYSVHSPNEFKQRMGEEFEFMVTPLVFDLELKIASDKFKIDKVYGVPNKNNLQADDSLISIKTLFPSSTSDNEIRGGIIMVKLSETKDDRTTADKETSSEVVILTANYSDKNQIEYSNDEVVILSDSSVKNTKGLEKGVLLIHYIDLVKSWIKDQTLLYNYDNADLQWYDNDHYRDGIYEYQTNLDDYIVEHHYEPILSQHERASIPLAVTPEYQKLFESFKAYYEKRSDILDDETLYQEIEILNVLIDN